MSESITDAFKCNQCGAWYESEKELHEHQQAVHHAGSHSRARIEDLDDPVKTN